MGLSRSGSTEAFCVPFRPACRSMHPWRTVRMYNPRMKKFAILLSIVSAAFLLSSFSPPFFQQGTYENSLVLAPLYVEYIEDSAEVFAREVAALKSAIGVAPYVKLGFAAFMAPEFPDIPLDNAIRDEDLDSDLARLDLMVERARQNGIINHIAFVSGFFHGQNPLRYSAVRQDVRNAQWFADGWITDPSQIGDPNTVPSSVWVTPSRYAQPLRDRIEEGVRILAAHTAGLMQRFPQTVLTVSGDGEVEFTFERNFSSNGTHRDDSAPLIWTDYSPFMVAEFRDWIRSGRYDNDRSPATDDDGNGHTFDGDFGQSFTSWKLRYFNDSGPIPYEQYVQLPEKLPSSGPYAFPGGFDAPRTESNDPFWTSWIEFRRQVIADWVRDFATWMTTSPDPDSGFTIPPSRFYTHQIPGDFIFGQSVNTRLKTSGSYVSTAVIDPMGSTGVTAFNGFDGRNHLKTATPALFASLFMTSDNWGVLEYNPSIPYDDKTSPSSDMRYYTNELRLLYEFRPHLIVPVLWSTRTYHRAESIKGSVFERSLHDFVAQVGRTPWFSWRAVLR
jgi:hypothetical protein